MNFFKQARDIKNKDSNNILTDGKLIAFMEKYTPKIFELFKRYLDQYYYHSQKIDEIKKEIDHRLDELDKLDQRKWYDRLFYTTNTKKVFDENGMFSGYDINTEIDLNNLDTGNSASIGHGTIGSDYCNTITGSKGENYRQSIYIPTCKTEKKNDKWQYISYNLRKDNIVTNKEIFGDGNRTKILCHGNCGFTFKHYCTLKNMLFSAANSNSEFIIKITGSNNLVEKIRLDSDSKPTVRVQFINDGGNSNLSNTIIEGLDITTITSTGCKNLKNIIFKNCTIGSANLKLDTFNQDSNIIFDNCKFNGTLDTTNVNITIKNQSTLHTSVLRNGRFYINNVNIPNQTVSVLFPYYVEIKNCKIGQKNLVMCKNLSDCRGLDIEGNYTDNKNIAPDSTIIIDGRLSNAPIWDAKHSPISLVPSNSFDGLERDSNLSNKLINGEAIIFNDKVKYSQLPSNAKTPLRSLCVMYNNNGKLDKSYPLEKIAHLEDMDCIMSLNDASTRINDICDHFIPIGSTYHNSTVRTSNNSYEP